MNCPFSGPERSLYLGGKALQLAAHTVAQCISDAATLKAPALSSHEIEKIREARDILIAAMRKASVPQRFGAPRGPQCPKTQSRLQARVRHDRIRIPFRSTAWRSLTSFLRGREERSPRWPSTSVIERRILQPFSESDLESLQVSLVDHAERGKLQSFRNLLNCNEHRVPPPKASVIAHLTTDGTMLNRILTVRKRGRCGGAIRWQGFRMARRYRAWDGRARRRIPFNSRHCRPMRNSRSCSARTDHSRIDQPKDASEESRTGSRCAARPDGDQSSASERARPGNGITERARSGVCRASQHDRDQDRCIAARNATIDHRRHQGPDRSAGRAQRRRSTAL